MAAKPKKAKAKTNAKANAKAKSKTKAELEQENRELIAKVRKLEMQGVNRTAKDSVFTDMFGIP